MASVEAQTQAKQTKAVLTGANYLQLHPERFIREVLGVEKIWSGQSEILASLPEAIATHQPVAVASGHALGKDFISSCIALWFLYCYWPSKVIITAPTDRQVKEIMWNEIKSRWDNKTVDLEGDIFTSPKIHINTDHFLVGFTTSNSNQVIGKAQGFHSPNILVIASEAQAIPDQIFEQIDGVLTSDISLLLMIGNPLITTGRFANALRDTKHNIVKHMDCEDSPNVQQGETVIPGMVSKAWVDDKRRRWHDVDPLHPLWLARVKGQLPQSSVSTVFDHALLRRAVDNRPVQWNKRKVCIGLDPAAFGDDETVFYVNECGVCKELVATSKHEPTDTAGRAVKLRVKHGAQMIAIDSDGLGEGVVSMVREMVEPGWQVLGIKGGNRPINVKRPIYFNRRAEMYFHARDMMQRGEVSIPDDPSLIAELAETQYFYTSKGLLQLEKKEDIKERLARSPDRADAFVLSCWGLKYTEADPNTTERYRDETPPGFTRTPDHALSYMVA